MSDASKISPNEAQKSLNSFLESGSGSQKEAKNAKRSTYDPHKNLAIRVGVKGSLLGSPHKGKPEHGINVARGIINAASVIQGDTDPFYTNDAFQAILEGATVPGQSVGTKKKPHEDNYVQLYLLHIAVVAAIADVERPILTANDVNGDNAAGSKYLGPLGQAIQTYNDLVKAFNELSPNAKEQEIGLSEGMICGEKPAVFLAREFPKIKAKVEASKNERALNIARLAEIVNSLESSRLKMPEQVDRDFIETVIQFIEDKKRAAEDPGTIKFQMKRNEQLASRGPDEVLEVAKERLEKLRSKLDGSSLKPVSSDDTRINDLEKKGGILDQLRANLVNTGEGKGSNPRVMEKLDQLLSDLSALLTIATGEPKGDGENFICTINGNQYDTSSDMPRKRSGLGVRKEVMLELEALKLRVQLWKAEAATVSDPVPALDVLLNGKEGEVKGAQQILEALFPGKEEVDSTIYYGPKTPDDLVVDTGRIGEFAGNDIGAVVARLQKRAGLVYGKSVEKVTPEDLSKLRRQNQVLRDIFARIGAERGQELLPLIEVFFQKFLELATHSGEKVPASLRKELSEVMLAFQRLGQSQAKFQEFATKQGIFPYLTDATAPSSLFDVIVHGILVDGMGEALAPLKPVGGKGPIVELPGINSTGMKGNVALAALKTALGKASKLILKDLNERANTDLEKKYVKLMEALTPFIGWQAALAFQRDGSNEPQHIFIRSLFDKIGELYRGLHTIVSSGIPDDGAESQAMVEHAGKKVDEVFDFVNRVLGEMTNPIQES